MRYIKDPRTVAFPSTLTTLVQVLDQIPKTHLLRVRAIHLSCHTFPAELVGRLTALIFAKELCCLHLCGVGRTWNETVKRDEGKLIRAMPQEWVWRFLPALQVIAFRDILNTLKCTVFPPELEGWTSCIEREADRGLGTLRARSAATTSSDSPSDAWTCLCLCALKTHDCRRICPLREIDQNSAESDPHAKGRGRRPLPDDVWHYHAQEEMRKQRSASLVRELVNQLRARGEDDSGHDVDEESSSWEATDGEDST
ncbi:hypothetical protein Purlil1_12455 [Purpureocillium lilacinum]|uniref:F-box domain-containing protein n=1 Tax=Purpureocillium lilacinum TaxID=33203 RepID=A0ABR0BH23_PURLI|nr:hypothetical protein Purlil1_12455 [Purpureocillium lilacinum]